MHNKEDFWKFVLQNYLKPDYLYVYLKKTAWLNFEAQMVVPTVTE